MLQYPATQHNTSPPTTFVPFLQIDGFPCRPDQAEAIESVIGAPVSVLILHCPEAEMYRRLLQRGLTSGRRSDTSPAIARRFNDFVKRTMPVGIKYDDRASALSFVETRTLTW